MRRPQRDETEREELRAEPTVEIPAEEPTDLLGPLPWADPAEPTWTPPDESEELPKPPDRRP